MDDVTRPDARGAASAATPSPRRYAAFLSYCHSDRAQAEALHRFLETYRLPRDLQGLANDDGPAEARLRPVFIDRADMPAGTDLRDEIDIALTASRALIVICSPAAAKSRWVDLEIERFKRHHGDARIFAVIIAGVAHGSATAEHAPRECFPPALRTRQTPDGPVRADPAAVDLRREGDGIQIGRLRLVAGLIGVPLDQLVHRDARRRQRRILALVAGLTLALAGTSALALYALAARNEAQRQRFAAEGMIEFMIGDLRKTLEPMGRLAAMDPLGKRALDYYRGQDAAALDADSLARRARVLLLLGEIQNERGNLDTALRNFQTAAATTTELLARAPADPKRIFDHAQSVYWVGLIAWRRGRIATARPAFEEYRRLSEQLVAIDPANPAYQAEKGYAYSNMGTMLYTTGRNVEAEVALRQALAVSLVLAKDKPADAAEQYDLAIAHAWVADVAERQGKYVEAETQRQLQRRVLAAMLAADPLNNAARESLADCDRAGARLALARGDATTATRLAGAAANAAKQMAAADTANAEAAFAAGLSYITLAEAQLAAGDVGAAATTSADARHYLAQLSVRDRRVAKWQLADVRGILLASRIAAAQGRKPEALAHAQAAIARLLAMPVEGQDASDLRWLRDEASVQAGEMLLALGKSEAAIESFANVVNDKPIVGNQEEPRIATLKARAEQAMRAFNDG